MFDDAGLGGFLNRTYDDEPIIVRTPRCLVPFVIGEENIAAQGLETPYLDRQRR